MYREAAWNAAAYNVAATNAATANMAYANAAAAQAAAANASAAQAAAANAQAAAAAAQRAAASLPIGTTVPYLPPIVFDHQRGQLFQLQRRLLQSRFSGKQRRVYRVNPVKNEERRTGDEW
jgi:hypothetical protein